MSSTSPLTFQDLAYSSVLPLKPDIALLYLKELPPDLIHEESIAKDYPPPKFYPSHVNRFSKKDMRKLTQTITDLDSSIIATPSSASLQSRSPTETSGVLEGSSSAVFSRRYAKDILELDQELCELAEAQNGNIKSIHQFINEGISGAIPFSLGPYDSTVDVTSLTQKEDTATKKQIEEVLRTDEEELAKVQQEIDAAKDVQNDRKRKGTPGKTHFTTVGTLDEDGQAIPVFELSIDMLLADVEGKTTTQTAESEEKSEKIVAPEQIQTKSEDPVGLSLSCSSSVDGEGEITPGMSSVTHVVFHHNRKLDEKHKVEKRQDLYASEMRTHKGQATPLNADPPPFSSSQSFSTSSPSSTSHSFQKASDSLPSETHPSPPPSSQLFFSDSLPSTFVSSQKLIMSRNRLLAPFDAFLSICEDSKDIERRMGKKST